MRMIQLIWELAHKEVRAFAASEPQAHILKRIGVYLRDLNIIRDNSCDSCSSINIRKLNYEQIKFQQDDPLGLAPIPLWFPRFGCKASNPCYCLFQHWHCYAYRAEVA